MTTSATSATISQTSTAGFDAWINEIYTGLVTACGLTQTADTGQMAVPCVTALPGTINTVAGYYIFAFNDTLQSTAPIYIKLEFGTGSVLGTPFVFITVGTGTNGAGTINGTVMTRVAASEGGAILSTATNYTSRYCYNATQGFLGMAFKQGANASVGGNASLIGFAIFRSVNGAGAPTGDSVMLLTNSNTASGANAGGAMQVLSYNLSAAYNGTNPIASASFWAFIPFASTGTLEGTAGQIFPIFQWMGSASTPGYGITNALALGLLSEQPLGTTVTVTVLGSTALTYISIAPFFGAANISGGAYSAGTYSVLMLWQ